MLFENAERGRGPTLISGKLYQSALNSVSCGGAFLRKFLGFLGLTPLVLTIVGLSFGLMALKEYQQAKLTEYRLLESYARNADVQITSALDRIDRQLHQMAEEKMKNQSAQDESVFGRELRAIPEISSWLETDATGRIRFSSNASIVDSYVSQELYFTAHRNLVQPTKMFISRPDKRLLGVHTIVFTLPIVSARGEFLGIVGITVGFKFFPYVLRDVHSEDSSSMSAISNRDGDLVFRLVDPEKFFGYNIAKISSIFSQHVRSGRQMTRHMSPSFYDGKLRFFLVREVGKTGLVLIVSRQLDDVLATWWHSVAIYTLIFALITAVMIRLSIVAARRKRQVLAGKVFSDQLIATANVIVVGQDSAGRITLFNDTAERLFGYDRDDVLGQHWFNLVLPPNASPEVMNMVELFQQGGDLPRTVEYVIRGKSGQQHVIAWQNSVIQTPRATISFGIDVTQQKQMEENLVVAVERAENRNAAKSRFLASISHDVRQPLHAQALFLDLFARTELNAHQLELLANTNNAANSCGEMLNTLLNFSRVEAGVLKPRLQSLCLQSLLNKIEREYGPQADAKGIVYRLRETDLRVQSDPMLLELILRNLISNAIRYTAHGGLLVTCRKRGADAMLEIWDTGIGISPADQKAVFSEFFQVTNAELDLQRGLGLGLAIVDGLARTLNHRLCLASRLRRGSVFRLYLPIAKGT